VREEGWGRTALRVSTVDRTCSNVASDNSDACPIAMIYQHKLWNRL
jgi:hypothetical protein